VLGVGEAVRGGRALGPRLDLASLDLDGAAARAADQVVVMTGRRAGAVDGLAVGALQLVGLAARGEGREGAVDGREPNAGVVLPPRASRTRSRCQVLR
jgi:hypothetical protein